MHYKELDHRSTPLRTLCTTATNAISELVQFSKVGILDSLLAAEYAEYFYGAVLVACQTYALGTVGDINEIRTLNGLGKLKKIELPDYVSCSIKA
ncbi:hypothetical protein CSQ88_16575 [Iodobacter sp. BJB302]|nr:hypothetical protein CSQ88_16575 [Iodobacter sp. BJB302]